MGADERDDGALRRLRSSLVCGQARGSARRLQFSVVSSHQAVSARSGRYRMTVARRDLHPQERRAFPRLTTADSGLPGPSNCVVVWGADQDAAHDLRRMLPTSQIRRALSVAAPMRRIADIPGAEEIASRGALGRRVCRELGLRPGPSAADGVPEGTQRHRVTQ